MDSVTEIKNKADIVELISQYTTLTRSGKTLKGLCPFHSEKHGSFFVYPDNQTWHCFGACATGGDVFSFIMKKEGLSFGEALERLAEKYGITLPSRQEPSPAKDQLDDLYRLNATAAQYFHDLLLTSPLAASARMYLEKRGVSADSIASFQLGFAVPEWQALTDYLVQTGFTDERITEAGLSGRADSGRRYDRFRDQIMIPIVDIRGRITGFGARVLDDSQPKYLNSPETPVFSKSATLFGINTAAAAIRQVDTAIVVEGYFDVIISHQFGFKNTVASMGTAITEKQITILKKLSHHLILALDADAAGEEAMVRCVPFENLLDTEIKVASAPAGQDPDEVIRSNSKDWADLISLSVPLIDFVFGRYSALEDLHTAAGKSGLAQRFLPVVAEINDPVRRGHYLTQLASRVGASTSDLQHSLNQLKKPPAYSQPISDQKLPITMPPVTASTVEDYLLALLIRHPELKIHCQSVEAEYFENIENREIFKLCRATGDPATVRYNLDSAIRGRFDWLSALPVIDTKLPERLAECATRLEEKYLKMTATKIHEILNTESDRGSVAELLRYREQGLALDSRLAELFKRKEARRNNPGR